MGSDSKQLFTEAQRWIPGGVNSPVRAWSAVGLEPRFVAEAEGARIRDVEGRDYIDYVGSWGPMLLGHRDPAVTRAVTEAVARGTSFGATTAGEVELGGVPMAREEAVAHGAPVQREALYAGIGCPERRGCPGP